MRAVACMLAVLDFWAGACCTASCSCEAVDWLLSSLGLLLALPFDPIAELLSPLLSELFVGSCHTVAVSSTLGPYADGFLAGERMLPCVSHEAATAADGSESTAEPRSAVLPSEHSACGLQAAFCPCSLALNCNVD